MSKKLKSLICALMAGTMLITSTGLVALADDPVETKVGEDGSAVEVTTEAPETAGGADVAENEKDADMVADIEAEQSAAAEEAAAAEAAAAEAAAKGYDNDTYYQNAIKVVSALGIITGYDDGSVKPESTVTRAEMATIVLRMLAQTGNAKYQNVFTDVDASHWAADIIQTAVEQGILDGMGDGTFVPDGDVTYEQVMKMIVCAMNYGPDAENAGGYPNGYVSVAGSNLKLITGVKGTVGAAMPRGEVIKAVYNALLASYREITDFSGGLPVYTAKDTLGVALFNMYEDEGVLTTTPNLSISTGSVKKAGIITIDGVDYKCSLNVDEYLATKVKFYYIDDKGDDPEVIAMFSMGKSTEYEFKADDIAEISTGSSGTMKVYKSQTSTSTTSYKINNATVIYNGSLLLASDVTGSYDDFITPHVGTVKIVDYDNDGTYDIIFVDKYETMLVTNATSEKLNGKIDNVNTTIEYDLDDNDYKVTVTKNGSEASVKNLRKNDVASIKRNTAGDTIDIVVTGESITGTITSVGEDEGDMTITVNGQIYKVDKNAEDSVDTGVSGTFYLDQFDRVGYIESTGALTGNEKYAMIAKVYYNDENEIVVRLFTQDGEEVEAKPAGSMKYWAPGATSSTKSPTEKQLEALNRDTNFIQCNGNPVKLCKYSLNSAGELSKLYVAVSTAKITNTKDYNDALVVYATQGETAEEASLRNVSAVGGTLNGYTINDGIVGFMVPDTAGDRSSGANYKANTVTASTYKSYDNGVDRKFAIGGFTSASTKTAGVLVEFTTSSSSMWGIDQVDTASVMPAIIVSKIGEAADAEGEIVYNITGYQNGTEVSYTTTQTTSVYNFKGWNDRQYDGSDLLFDATGVNKKANFLDVVSVGDIVVLGAAGSDIRTMVKLVDADDIAKLAVTGSGGTLTWTDWVKGSSAIGSSSREFYYMGFVSAVDIDDSAFIGLRDYDGSVSGAVTYNTSQIFSLVTLTVDTNGKITNTKVDKSGGIEPSELYAWGDDEDVFDFAIFTSLKGNMNSGYVVRVQIDR
ncbi:MAG: S-layer homology domain-containing protein [Oscillospiraceae bacterium]|nr:S-layer homology domain-containing protein [Oscillospiraceae bacterium]